MNPLDPVGTLLLFVALPALALILLTALLFLAVRGGRPINLKLAGFGVTLDFSSTANPGAPTKEET